VKVSRSAVCKIPAVLLIVSLATSWSSFAGAATAPKSLSGHLLVCSGGEVAFGTHVTHSVLNGGTIQGEVLHGKYGYALATIGNYQYPVATDDLGKEWRIAGCCFNLVSTSAAGAEGTATSLTVFSRATAIAFRAGDIIGPDSNIYVTTDSGKRWYVTAVPGTVHGVASNLRRTNQSILPGMFAIVYSSSPSGGKFTYESLDRGRNWSLLANSVEP